MTTRMPWGRERYERIAESDHPARLAMCLSAARREASRQEWNLAYWWLNTAAMHVQALQAQQNTTSGTRGRRP